MSTWSQFTKYYDCPVCGKKEVAVQSQTYPEFIVHKCDGKVLHEVGNIKKGVVTQLANSPALSPKGIILHTRNFTISQLMTIDEVMDCGMQLNNAARVRSSATEYFTPSGHKLFSVTTRAHNQTKFMILVADKKIYNNDVRFFSGYSLSEIEEVDGVEILKELVRAGVLSKNPFPDLYPF